MLVMITHVQIHGIHHTIITLSFLVAVCEEMFLNPAGTEWMQSHGKKETHGHIGRCLPSEEINKEGHENCLHDNIYNSPPVHQGNFFNSSWTDHLENGIEQQPECFSKS